MADVKRPTAQDIEDFRQVLDGGMRQSLGSDTTTPDHAAVVWQMWVRFTGVLDYAADCLRAEEEGERVPEVEAPEDAGDNGWIPWEGGECPVPADALVEVVDRDGHGWNIPAGCHDWQHNGGHEDVVLYRLAQPSKPPTDPEARVRAMSDEEVEAALVNDHAIRPWSTTWPAGRGFRLRIGHGFWLAVGVDGQCWSRSGDRFDDVTGDTTTPEGRAECSRRLLVYMLREETP